MLKKTSAVKQFCRMISIYFHKQTNNQEIMYNLAFSYLQRKLLLIKVLFAKITAACGKN